MLRLILILLRLLLLPVSGICGIYGYMDEEGCTI